MSLLLDTHIYLWWLNDDKKLPQTLSKLIQNADRVYVSTVSIWEIGIKIKLGRFDADMNAIINGISACNFHELPLVSEHVRHLMQLPVHHTDPFDRMLIAQARCGPLHFLTADQTLTSYSELVVV